MPRNSKLDKGLYILTVALLSWAVPGLGYAVVKEFRRALVCFIGIVFLFVLGLYLGSIGVIDPVNSRSWYMAQIMTSPVVSFIANTAKQAGYSSYGKPFEIGQIYTTVAGLLNLLCIISASYMAYYGRTELIGEEDA